MWWWWWWWRGVSVENVVGSNNVSVELLIVAFVVVSMRCSYETVVKLW